MTRDDAEQLLHGMRRDLDAMIEGDVLPNRAADTNAHRAHMQISYLLDVFRACRKGEPARPVRAEEE